MYFRYSKINWKRPGTQKYFTYFQSYAVSVERLETAGRQTSNLNTFFSKVHFSTRLTVELQQFLSDCLEISKVSVRLNYLHKYEGFFQYVELVWVTKHFSRFFYDCHFFKNQYFWKRLRCYEPGKPTPTPLPKMYGKRIPTPCLPKMYKVWCTRSATVQFSSILR